MHPVPSGRPVALGCSCARAARPRWDGAVMAVTRAVTADLRERKRKKKKKKKQANINPGSNVSRFARAPGASSPNLPLSEDKEQRWGGAAARGRARRSPERSRTGADGPPPPSRPRRSDPFPARAPRCSSRHRVSRLPRPFTSPRRPDRGCSPDARRPPQPRFVTRRFAPRRPLLPGPSSPR